jgi:hypothetical protein
VSYERTIEVDTGFALAYWRLGTVRGWLYSVADSLSHVYGLRAGELNRGLAARESLLIACDSLKATLDEFGPLDGAAEQRVQRLFRTTAQAVRRYPTDPESWVALGEARLHFGAGRGVSNESRLDAFARAIVLDSMYAPAYFHAVQLASTLQDLKAVQRYAAGYLALGPGHDDAVTVRTVALILGPNPRSEETARLLDSLSFDGLLSLLQHFAATPDSNEVGLEIDRRLVAQETNDAHPELDAETRHAFYAKDLAYRGHVRQAYQILSAYPGVMAWGTFTGLAFAGVVPADTARAVFRHLLDQPPGQNAGGLHHRLGFPLPWWAAQRDTSAIKQYILLIKSKPQSEMVAWKRYLLEASEAYLALALADTAAAIQRLQALPTSSGLVWYERLTLARLLSALKRDREALEVLDRGFPWGFPAFEEVLWAFERARVAERLGEREKAQYWYGYVTRVWRHADPELRPLVSEAREALQRLVSETQ